MPLGKVNSASDYKGDTVLVDMAKQLQGPPGQKCFPLLASIHDELGLVRGDVGRLRHLGLEEVFPH